MRPKDVALFLRYMLKHPDSPAIFLWGPPGIGKSAVARQVAVAARVGFVDLRLANMDPTDLRGIIVPKEGKAVWLVSAALPTGGSGILFLDELNLAPPLVQSSAYQLVLDKCIGEYSLPKDWMIAAAGNRSEHGANVYKMSMPLRNRFVHIDFTLNVDDWCNWALHNGIKSEVIEFITFRPDLLSHFDPKSADNAFASPRTWEFASKIMRDYEDMPREIMSEVLQGTLGTAPALEFSGYLDIRKELPSIDEILAGKDFVPEKLDIACAIVGALVARAKPELYPRLFNYAEKIEIEAAILLVKMLLAKDTQAVIRTPEYQRFAVAHADLLSR